MQPKLSRLILRSHPDIKRQSTEIQKDGLPIRPSPSDSPLGPLSERASDSESPPQPPHGSNDSAIRYLADAWPLLPPPIRDAIFTLVDGALLQQQLKGTPS